MRVSNPKEFDEGAKASADEAFKQFLQSPETKMLLSMIPAAEPPELVHSLLQAAYFRGHHVGVSYALMETLKACIVGGSKKED